MSMISTLFCLKEKNAFKTSGELTWTPGCSQKTGTEPLV